MSSTISQKQTKLREAVLMYETLKKEWDRDKRQRDLSKAQQLVTNLKLLLTELSFMPTSGESSKQESLLIRSVLEIATLLAIEKQDLEGFERNMAELKTYYFDVSDELAESPYYHHLLGLDLLNLLAQNRLADFHANLELLPREATKKTYIRHPIQLEQFLMEGSYNKIFLARENVPAENYKFFMDILVMTVRSEIAKCMEEAYDHLSVSDVARLLHFTPAETKEFASKRNWKMEPNGEIAFRRDLLKLHKLNVPGVRPQQPENKEMTDSTSMAVEDVAKNLLGYAHSLETII